MKTLYWSRWPGHFVNKNTGELYSFAGSNGPAFTGTVREWYETLVETMIDLRNQIGDSTRGDVMVNVGASTLAILECSVLYKPRLDERDPFEEGDAGTLCGMKVVLTNKLDLLACEMHASNGTHGKVIITQK